MSNPGSYPNRPSSSSNNNRSRRPAPPPSSTPGSSAAHAGPSAQWGEHTFHSGRAANSPAAGYAGPSSQPAHQSGGSDGSYGLPANSNDPQEWSRRRRQIPISTGISYGGHPQGDAGHSSHVAGVTSGTPHGDESFLSFSGSDGSANSSPRIQGDDSFLTLSGGSSNEGSPREHTFPHNVSATYGGSQSSPSSGHGSTQSSPRGSGSNLNTAAGGSGNNGHSSRSDTTSQAGPSTTRRSNQA